MFMVASCSEKHKKKSPFAALLCPSMYKLLLDSFENNVLFRSIDYEDDYMLQGITYSSTLYFDKVVGSDPDGWLVMLNQSKCPYLSNRLASSPFCPSTKVISLSLPSSLMILAPSTTTTLRGLLSGG
ncbi:hypothetical protein LIER_42985 [Lithospermum erythrorhizon]|uniref:Uncharacterized protein n=1 Tax=Lithospermum erythrorhizon TaxID=34254 RepID=A0AAV3PDV6_LITER